MKIVLTVVLAAIFLAAVWSGYRRGLILSAAQLAAIVVALYGAALLAGLFSDRLLPVAEPFAGGYFERQLDVVAAAAVTTLVFVTVVPGLLRKREALLGKHIEK